VRKPFSSALFYAVGCWSACYAGQSVGQTAEQLSNAPRNKISQTKARHDEGMAMFKGTVKDPSGALIPDASVVLVSYGKEMQPLHTDATGRFAKLVPYGLLQLTVSAPGFNQAMQTVHVQGTTTEVEVRLTVAVDAVSIEVDADGASLSTTNDANKNAIDLQGGDLATLSDDDKTFQQQLLALAGDDGSHPPQVYVDGFSSGRFPPKTAIREVRINANPFSAEYEAMGLGRIEVFTKPGTGKLHGSLDLYGDPSALNSRNPFLGTQEPPYYRVHSVGSLSGPLGSKASFFLSGDYYDQQNNAIINAQTVDSSGAIQALSQAVPNPLLTGQYTGRFDRQISSGNTFIVRYEADTMSQHNGGLSEYVLPSEAFNTGQLAQTFQLRNTQLIGAYTVVDSHFQWLRTHSDQDPLSTAPSILVQGTVSGGGSPLQMNHDHLDETEAQIGITYAKGRHTLRTGVRYRYYREANTSTQGFNGSFTFASLVGYQAFVQGSPQASQFQLTAGQASFATGTDDIAGWLEDEWQARKNLTLLAGVRLESQSAVPDSFDPSPHLGVSWGLGKKRSPAPLVVFRFGSGIFYSRFPVSDLLTVARQGDAAKQQTYLVTNPNFTAAAIPSNAQLATTTSPSVYRLAPDLGSAYEIDSSVSADIGLGKRGSVSLVFLDKEQRHQRVSINANAPLADGTRPYGLSAGNLYQFISEATGRGIWFYIDPRYRLNSTISFTGHFNFKRQNSSTMGDTSFASNSYDVHQDYGRSSSDRHQSAYVALNLALKRGFRSTFVLNARAGEPFNITTGADNNGDTIFNDRPSFATPASDPQYVVHTLYGNLNLRPKPGEAIIPVDFGHSAGPFVSLQMQLGKTWEFGPASPRAHVTAGAGDTKLNHPPYSVTLSGEVQNLTNTVSPAPPVGVLKSPFFGKSIATSNNFLSTSAANRTIMLHCSFQF